MFFNKAEKLSLPAKEKIALSEKLWSSVEEELFSVSDVEEAIVPF